VVRIERRPSRSRVAAAPQPGAGGAIEREAGLRLARQLASRIVLRDELDISVFDVKEIAAFLEVPPSTVNVGASGTVLLVSGTVITTITQGMGGFAHLSRLEWNPAEDVFCPEIDPANGTLYKAEIFNGRILLGWIWHRPPLARDFDGMVSASSA
jgi:hypothetical protein